MHRWTLTLTFLLFPLVATAATLVVATSGSDGNPCTADAPCRTMRHALDGMSDGDTLTIHGGTYDENHLSPPSGSTVEGAAGETVILQSTDSTGPGFELSQHADHITVRNLTIDGSGGGISYGMLVYTSDCLIENVTIQNVQNQGIALYREPPFAPQRCTLRNDHVSGSGVAGCHGTTPQDGYCHGVYNYTGENRIEGGEYDHNNGYGIQTYGPGLTITGAFVHDNVTGGLTIPGDGSAHVSNSVFTHNSNGEGTAIFVGSNSSFRDVSIVDNPGAGLFLPAWINNTTFENIRSSDNHPNVYNEAGLSVSVDGTGASLP